MSTACLNPPIAAAPRPGKTRQPSRRAGLDLARLLAAYSIVWLHTPRCLELQASQALGRFAVPFFVFAAVLLVFEGVERNPERTFRQYAWNRFVRIYVPFLAWSGIYLAFKGLKAFLLPDQPNDFPGLNLLWEGGFYHLWFMPFILVVSLVAFAVAKAVANRQRLAWTVGGLSLGAGMILAAAAAPWPLVDAGPYGRLLDHALPAVGWAMALAIVAGRLPAGWTQRPGVSLAAAGLALAGTGWIWGLRDGVKWAETLAGLGVMILALRPLASPLLARLARLGPLAYGIYLAHLLVIKTLESLAATLGLPVSWQADLTVFLVAAGLSTLLAWTLSRWPTTRWLVA